LRIDDYAPKTDIHAGLVNIDFIAERLDVLVPSLRDQQAEKPQPEVSPQAALSIKVVTA
jgi:hypothetical protein